MCSAATCTDDYTVPVWLKLSFITSSVVAPPELLHNLSKNRDELFLSDFLETEDPSSVNVLDFTCRL